jgi:hypothetical protein
MPRKPRQRSPRPGIEYRFKIDAWTPDTLPMSRLSEYMAELAQLLGEKTAVHFRRLLPGSCVLVHRIDSEASPKVRERVKSVRLGVAPSDAARAYKTINRLLRDDNAVGVLRAPKERGVVIRFPGREEKQETFASVKQFGSIDGIITWVGGSDQTAHITLETEGQQVSRIYTTRAIAKDLGRKLFEPVRLNGRGKWSRDSEGTWALIDFKVESFEGLDDAPLSSVVNQLRAIPTDWTDESYTELDSLRRGPKGGGRGKNGGH